MRIRKCEGFIVPGIKSVFKSWSQKAEFSLFTFVVDESFDHVIETRVIKKHWHRGWKLSFRSPPS